MLEFVVGLIDVGEILCEVVICECVEEVNVILFYVELMFGVYLFLGGLIEYYYCFVGIVDLLESDSYFGGLEDEFEDLKFYVLLFDKVMELVIIGEICVLFLIGMLYWLDCNCVCLCLVG